LAELCLQVSGFLVDAFESFIKRLYVAADLDYNPLDFLCKSATS